MKCVRFIFLLLAIPAFSQSNVGVKAEIGLNRIGVFYDFGIEHQWFGHQLYWGVRYYEPDIVFERNLPGASIGYFYQISPWDKFRFNIGIELNFFHENKGSSNLWLLDPKLKFGPGWKLSDRFDLAINAGFGNVFNFVETSTLSEIEKFNYLNYELSLRLTYYLRTGHSD